MGFVIPPQQFHVETKHSSNLKGTLHPQMKILSSFTHPQVVANLNFLSFFLLLDTKEDILKNHWSLLNYIVFIYLFYYGSQ